tara:strand:+ start:254 stop:376 length:123 start_codon:yes stop_codon:yes gene_type:complete
MAGKKGVDKLSDALRQNLRRRKTAGDTKVPSVKAVNSQQN